MPTPNPTLHKLWDEYARLVAGPAISLTTEQRRGISFYLADTEADATVEPFVARWVRHLHAIETFIDDHQRLPRTDSRRPRPRNHEQSLVDVLAYFREVGRAGGYCDYQVRRLEVLPGFSWAPRQDAWREMFAAHQEFWSINGRPPRRRSSDPDEVRIGRWVAQQRTLLAAERLEPSREATLREARYRIL